MKIKQQNCIKEDIIQIQPPQNNISIRISQQQSQANSQYQHQRQQEQPQPQFQANPQHYSQVIPLLYKLLLSLCFIISYTLYRILYIKFDNSKCLIDTYFQATYEANRWLRYTGGNVIIGIGQVMMDAWILCLGIAWLILVKNMRFPISAGIIFLFRTFFLNIQKLPFDQYIVWHSPGFLSFTVPYDRTRDFFFSGHTSTLLIIMLQFITLKFYKTGIFVFFNLIFMLNMLIITRIHYTIDIIAALIFATTVYRLTGLIIKYVDFVFSIMFYVIRYGWSKIKQKKEKEKKNKQYEMLEKPNINHNNIILQTEQIIRGQAN